MTTQAPARHGLGAPTSTTRTPSGSPIRSRSGTSCARSARSRTPTATAATWLPVRHEDVAAVAYDTEHFTSRSVVVSELRPGRRTTSPRRSASRRRSPPTRRSTRWRAPAAAAGVRAQDASPRYEPFTRELCVELLDATRRQGARSTPRSTTPSTSRCGSSCRCSASRRKTPTSSAGSSTWSSKTSTVGAEERQALVNEGELDDYIDARIEEHHRRAAGRPHDLPARSRARRQQAPPRPRARHDGAADDRRHRHDVVGDRRVAVAPRAEPRRPQAARGRARRSWPPRSRSSCARTRRSRWRAWSPRTSSSTAAR